MKSCKAPRNIIHSVINPFFFYLFFLEENQKYFKDLGRVGPRSNRRKACRPTILVSKYIIWSKISTLDLPYSMVFERAAYFRYTLLGFSMIAVAVFISNWELFILNSFLIFRTWAYALQSFVSKFHFVSTIKFTNQQYNTSKVNEVASKLASHP